MIRRHVKVRARRARPSAWRSLRLAFDRHSRYGRTKPRGPANGVKVGVCGGLLRASGASAIALARASFARSSPRRARAHTRLYAARRNDRSVRAAFFKSCAERNLACATRWHDRPGTLRMPSRAPRLRARDARRDAQQHRRGEQQGRRPRSLSSRSPRVSLERPVTRHRHSRRARERVLQRGLDDVGEAPDTAEAVSAASSLSSSSASCASTSSALRRRRRRRVSRLSRTTLKSVVSSGRWRA